MFFNWYQLKFIMVHADDKGRFLYLGILIFTYINIWNNATMFFESYLWMAKLSYHFAKASVLIVFVFYTTRAASREGSGPCIVRRTKLPRLDPVKVSHTHVLLKNQRFYLLVRDCHLLLELTIKSHYRLVIFGKSSSWERRNLSPWKH